jgi:hypothetical protein
VVAADIRRLVFWWSSSSFSGTGIARAAEMTGLQIYRLITPIIVATVFGGGEFWWSRHDAAKVRRQH